MSQNTILIVDDSRLSRMLLVTIIRQAHPDWKIIEAESGDDAMAKSDSESITYMTLDYNMPGMDGLTLASKMRERFPTARISLLTANIQHAICKKAEEIGI